MSNPIRILLMDDDPGDRVESALAREFLPVQVDRPYTEEAFLQALEQGGYDLVITECHLRWISGGEVLRRTRSCRPGCPVLMITTPENEREAIEALGSGMDNYVLKTEGFGPRLVVAVNTCLRRTEFQTKANRTEKRLGSLLTRLRVGVFRSTGSGRILEANPAFLALLGFASLKEAQEHGMDKVWARPEGRAQVMGQMREHGTVQGAEIELMRADGRIIWGLLTMTLSSSPDGELTFDGLLEDISERKLAAEALRESEELLKHDTFYDGLTGLPNRALFMEKLRAAAQRQREGAEHAFALLVINVDRFQFVNDSLGHVMGDQLIIAVAHRLKSCLRPEDTLARLGGDEFAILLEEMQDPAGASGIAERIHQDLEHPFELSGHEIFATASIGIAPSTAAFDGPEVMLRDADTALHRAKTKGRARHEVFNASMHTHAVELLKLEGDLRRALDREEFAIYFQPIVALDNWKIAGFEALLRWNHPERGLVLPEEFIPLAEETGLIIPIAKWVLLGACRQASIWQAAYPSHPPLTVSVNLSSRNLAHPDLIAQVDTALVQSGLGGSSLGLEITESALIENSEHALSVLANLRALNIRLQIDDFGTGYSSLSYLQQFPIDTLKIDRSFTSRMPGDGQSSEIVRTILSLARNLHLSVVAEGVETREQAESLHELHCELAQGFFFHPPLDAGQVSALLRSRPRTRLV